MKYSKIIGYLLGKLTGGISAAVAMSIVPGAGAYAYAQDFPTRSIEIVAAVPSGSATDILSRRLAEKLQERLGVPVVVLNKPGGGTVIATEYVASSEPDGYTLLMGNSALSFASVLHSNLPYDPNTAFAPIGIVAESPFVLVANSEVGVNSVTELFALAKEKPGTLNYASGGLGSATHIACELLSMRADIDIEHVPYSSPGLLVPDLVSNRTQIMCSPLLPWLSMIKAGKVIALGIAQENPLTDPMELPSIKQETGVDYLTKQWYALLAPSETPQAVMDTLGQAFDTVLNDPEFQEQLANGGLSVGDKPLVLEEAAAFMSEQRELLSPVAESTGVKLD